MTPEVVIVGTIEEAAGWVERAAPRVLVVAGGTTPLPLYRALRLPWDEVAIYPGDERADGSNLRAIRGAFDARARVRELGEDLPVPDLLLLGMGEDGHTASLFPGSPALGETVRRVVRAGDRTTITPVVIAEAKRIAVLVSGARKGPMLRRVLRDPPDPVLLPAQLALRGTWFVDRAAAAASEVA